MPFGCYGAPPKGSKRSDRTFHLWRYSFSRGKDKGKDAWYIAQLGTPPAIHTRGELSDEDYFVTRAVTRGTTAQVPLEQKTSLMGDKKRERNNRVGIAREVVIKKGDDEKAWFPVGNHNTHGRVPDIVEVHLDANKVSPTAAQAPPNN